MTDQDTSLTAKFRQARENRGVTLDQAHRDTGISVKVLRGLEADSTDTVELIYLRLAMISYAEYLGLDGLEIARMFDAETGYRPGKQMQSPPPSSAAFSGSRPAKSNILTDISRFLRGVSSLTLIVAGVVLLVVLVSIAAWLDLDLSPGGTDEPPGAPIGDAPATAEKSVSHTVVSPRRVDGGPAAGEEAGTRGSSRTRSDAADTTLASPMSGVEMAQAAEPTAPLEIIGRWGPSSVPPPPGLVLEAVAVDTTWVQVLWDGEDGIEATMVTGERRQWAARDSFFVRSGIAHGVQFSLQGQLLGEGRLGDPDEVLRFRASKAGVVLLSRNLEPVGEPIRITDRDRADRDSADRDSANQDGTGG